MCNAASSKPSWLGSCCSPDIRLPKLVPQHQNIHPLVMIHAASMPAYNGTTAVKCCTGVSRCWDNMKTPSVHNNR